MTFTRNQQPAAAHVAVADMTSPAAQGGLFLINLCPLVASIAIPQPQSGAFNRHRFFVSRRRVNGVERFFLHMGYFSTAVEAQKWLMLLRRTYPRAFTSQIPGQPTEAGPAAATTRLTRAGAAAPVAPQFPQAADASSPSLTDTQVLTVLATRGPSRDPRIGEIDYGDARGSDISLLRPDDTDTRRTLREAVIRNEPVSFAVHLDWSPHPIDLEKARRLPIFKHYTLYATESRRDERGGFHLRLGFFTDAISARQVAHYVRAEFESVAVVPVSTQERLRAEQGAARSALSQPTVQTPPAARAPAPKASYSLDAGAKKSARKPASAGSLEETLEILAASEIELNDDPLSITGVRHLRVEVRKKGTRSLKSASSRTRK